MIFTISGVLVISIHIHNCCFISYIIYVLNEKETCTDKDIHRAFPTGVIGYLL